MQVSPVRSGARSSARADPLAADLAGHGVATEHARRLLADLGVRVRALPGPPDPHPALAWARSGAMALCGHAHGLPRVPPGPLASCAVGAARALEALGGRAPADPAALLGERAALSGLSRRGRVSAGGSCRLLCASDAWVAVSLARDADVAALPAWLENAWRETGSSGPVARPDAAWTRVAAGVRRRPAALLARRAAWLGLPFAVAAPPSPGPPPWLRVAADGPRAEPPRRAPRVVDLSSLWAGPLCGALLAASGAEVVKVESLGRPDGARAGAPAFHDLLNARKRSVVLDFASGADLALLHDLVASADLVLESTRPRALAQLGLDAEAFVAARPGRVWVSITGYGRADAAPGRVAFGDDAAVAAGLASAVGDAGGPVFCGDAIADPLTGLHAALAAWATWRAGGGALLDLSLRDVAAHAHGSAEVEGFAVLGDPGCARVETGSEQAAVRAPRARVPRARAPTAGADTEALRRALGHAC